MLNNNPPLVQKILLIILIFFHVFLARSLTILIFLKESEIMTPDVCLRQMTLFAYLNSFFKLQLDLVTW